MAIKALDIGKTRNFTSKHDTDGDPTIWKIGILSSRDKGAIRDSSTSFTFNKEAAETEGDSDETNIDTRIERSKMNFEAVRRGLKGWDNFVGPDGDDVCFKFRMMDVGGGRKQNVVPNELLDLIPIDVIDELSEQIMSDATVPAGDVKNSQEQSSEGSSTPTGTAQNAQPQTEASSDAEDQ